MSSYTRGPWNIIHCDDGNLTVSYSDGAVRSHIATCYDTALAPKHGSLSANARLIASAPDLLAALEEFIRLDEESGLQATDGGELVSALHIARAAITKATK
jgi:hypothetical protein